MCHLSFSVAPFLLYYLYLETHLCLCDFVMVYHTCNNVVVMYGMIEYESMVGTNSKANTSRTLPRNALVFAVVLVVLCMMFPPIRQGTLVVGPSGPFNGGHLADFSGSFLMNPIALFPCKSQRPNDPH